MAEMFLPVAGITANDLTDTFGADRSGGRSHKGIDIFAKEGMAVVAVRSGTVVKSGNSGLGGLRVWVKDEDGVFHYYAHLSAIDVKDGQKVKAGQRIGAVGKTGNAASTPAHLHYSVNPAGSSSEAEAYNPYEYLTGASPVQAEDSFTASARRQQRAAVGVPELGSDEEYLSAAEKFTADRQVQSQTMADIMSFISTQASQSGGKVLDGRALFGDIFGADDTEPDTAPEEVA